MIAIINYGLGNVQAFANIYKRLGISAVIATTTDDLTGCQKIILPGVGAFDWAMTRLNSSGLRETLEMLVLIKRIPVLGVCVGMQMLGSHSEEGQLSGLGWIEGDVTRFNEAASISRTHLPHMGWNDVMPKNGDTLFKNLESGARFYFLHSYYFIPKNKNHVLAETDYGGLYASCIQSENVYGVQFHPEKSHQWGIQLLKNFAEL
jgi:glutamine amidotransferase